MCVAKTRWQTKKVEDTGFREQGSNVTVEKEEIPKMVVKGNGIASLECSQSRIMEKDGDTQESDFLKENKTY